jgi:hypothetical protein
MSMRTVILTVITNVGITGNSLLFNAPYIPRFDLGWQFVRRRIMNLEYVRAIHIYVIRNNKTIAPYTTLYYSNIKSYKFQLYDTLIITFQFSLFNKKYIKRKSYICSYAFNSNHFRLRSHPFIYFWIVKPDDITPQKTVNFILAATRSSSFRIKKKLRCGQAVGLNSAESERGLTERQTTDQKQFQNCKRK